MKSDMKKEFQKLVQEEIKNLDKKDLQFQNISSKIQNLV